MTTEAIAKLDQYREHKMHHTFNPHCSTCFSENRLIQAKRTVDNRLQNALYDMHLLTLADRLG